MRTDLFADHVAPQPKIWATHCGHPTAHRPWYPEGAGVSKLVTFRTKEQCEAYGRAVVSYGEAQALQMFGWGEP